MDEFFAPAIQQILKSVKKIPIVRTRSGKWVEPSNALIVPRQLLYEDEPLFTEQELKRAGINPSEYTCSAYDRGHLHSTLTRLGCQTLNANSVFSVISSTGLQFSEKPYGWLAVLFQYLFENSSFQFSRPRYLQLEDNTWTSIVISGRVYLPHSSRLQDGVDNLNLAVLHEDFYREITQNAVAEIFLTRTLNIVGLGVADIVRAIIKTHEQARLSTSLSLEASVCIKHAAYLSSHRHDIDYDGLQKLKLSFHLVDQLGEVITSPKEFIINHQIQMQSPIRLSEVAPASSFHFLNKAYSDAVMDFLQEILCIMSFPPPTEEKRIFMRRTGKKRQIKGVVVIPSPFYTELLSPEAQTSNVLLYYLADIWEGLAQTSAVGVLLSALRETCCVCEDGSLTKLPTCFLRTRQLNRFLTSGLKVLQVESPDDPKWLFLKDLGVSTEPSLEIFIEDLRRKKVEIADGDASARIDWLYKDLVLFCQGNLNDFSPLR